MADVGEMLHCVAKQYRRWEQADQVKSCLATAMETENVKPNHCVTKRVTKLENEAFALFTKVLNMYRPGELMVSFNGGKDCTVLLDLVLSFFANNKCIRHVRIPVLYIETENSFDEVEPVILDCERRYNINLYRRKGCMKEVLGQILRDIPRVRAIFMGSRRTDPHCANLNVMQTTDPDWPTVMRIHPLIDWNYVDIWYYLFVRQIPYCSLYENGYTSLGQKHNTVRNPYLRVIDPITKAISFKHAAELQDVKHERAGRGTFDAIQMCSAEKDDENDEAEGEGKDKN